MEIPLHMRKIKPIYFLIIIISINSFISINVDGYTTTIHAKSNTGHELIIDALSWKSFHMECQTGEVLTGSFQSKSDGSLYPGDEQKYDDWILQSIQFYIFDKENYQLFVEKQEFQAAFVREDVSRLEWTFQIPDTGEWYVVYYNNSIYMMTVTGAIKRLNSNNQMMFAVIIIVFDLSILLTFSLHRLRKR